MVKLSRLCTTASVLSLLSELSIEKVKRCFSEARSVPSANDFVK